MVLQCHKRATKYTTLSHLTIDRVNILEPGIILPSGAPINETRLELLQVIITKLWGNIIPIYTKRGQILVYYTRKKVYTNRYIREMTIESRTLAPVAQIIIIMIISVVSTTMQILSIMPVIPVGPIIT